LIDNRLRGLLSVTTIQGVATIQVNVVSVIFHNTEYLIEDVCSENALQHS